MCITKKTTKLFYSPVASILYSAVMTTFDVGLESWQEGME